MARNTSRWLLLVVLSGCGAEAPEAPAPVESSEPSEPAAPEAPAAQFSEEAELRAAAPGSTDAAPREVILRWDPAEHAARYEVQLDATAVGTVDAPAVEYRLEGVTFETSRSFAVVALNEDGQRSDPIETRDALSPAFPEGASISVASVSEGLRLRWPPAEDDVAVTGYALERDGEFLAELGPETHSYLLSDEPPGDVTVAALDAAGHKTRLRVTRARLRRLAGPVGVTCDSCGSLGGLASLSRSGPVSGEPPARRVRGRVVLESASARGGVSGAAVNRMMRARVRAIQACYERELRRQPALAGRVVVHFDVGPNGTVTNALPTENTSGSGALANCVRNTVRRFRFPAGAGASVEVAMGFSPSP